MSKKKHIPMQWFASDLHFGHKNIIRNLTNWKNANPDSLRPFESVEEMNAHIIEQINLNVHVDDELYLLGDFYFGKEITEVLKLLRAIKCMNIYLILGNHDWLIKKNMHAVTSMQKIHMIQEATFKTFKFPLEGQDPNREKWKGRVAIHMSHYAHRIWRESHLGAWMLYGHSHASLDNTETHPELEKMINEYYLQHNTMDVGIDNIYRLFGEYRPISRIELEKVFADRKALRVDHHNEKTNP